MNTENPLPERFRVAVVNPEMSDESVELLFCECERDRSFDTEAALAMMSKYRPSIAISPPHGSSADKPHRRQE